MRLTYVYSGEMTDPMIPESYPKRKEPTPALGNRRLEEGRESVRLLVKFVEVSPRFGWPRLPLPSFLFASFPLSSHLMETHVTAAR
jgi:hypothetical protein